MKICEFNELNDMLHGIDYHYSLINFNNIPIDETVKFSSKRGERPWSRIMLVTEGEAEIACAGSSFVARCGECISIPRDSEFNLEWKSGGAEGKVCSYVMAFSLYNKQGEEIVLSENPMLVESRDGQYMFSLFSESVREYSEKGSEGRLKCKALLLDLLSRLCYPAMCDCSDGKARSDTVKIAMQHMERHFSGDMDIADLTSLCHTSESTLRRSFRKEIGVAPMVYLGSIRMRRAYDLLMQGEMSVSEVAIAVNIPDVSYFSRRFKQTFGVSPAKIRRG